MVSAHAINGGGPTAQIIEREGWKCDKDFVGHRKAVTCVRFHTAILKRQTPKTQKPQQYCCLAVGSRDRSLSVWMTALQRPLVVIHELFSDSILDLSWGPDKYILMACSGDGTVACLQFSENELGTPLSEEERNVLYQRIYGKSAANLTNGSSTVNDVLIENPELILNNTNKLKPPTLPTIQVTNHNNNYVETTETLPSSNGFGGYENKSIFSQNSSTNNNTNTSMGFGQTTPIKAISKQMETRTKDGKRRITPMFIPLNSDVSENSASAASITTANRFQSMESEESSAARVFQIPTHPAESTLNSINNSKENTNQAVNLPKSNITEQDQGYALFL